jgi:solute carrier family 25 (mitochondrial carnitine/acylcarnitine transporter), member 20/29
MQFFFSPLRWQVRRQLEYTIAEKKGLKLVKPPSTASAVRDIFKTSGVFGLYTGFNLHFGKKLLLSSP